MELSQDLSVAILLIRIPSGSHQKEKKEEGKDWLGEAGKSSGAGGQGSHKERDWGEGAALVNLGRLPRTQMATHDYRGAAMAITLRTVYRNYHLISAIVSSNGH